MISCRSCGASVEALAAGTLWVIGETDLEGLGSLLSGALDAAACAACRAPLGRTATLVAVLPSKGTVLFTPGDVLPRSSDVSARVNWRTLLPAPTAPHVIECQDATVLRRAVVTELAGRLGPIRLLARAAADGGAADMLSARWRAFTPPVFAAAHLALSGDVPQLEIGHFEASGASDTSLAPLIAPHRYDQVARLATVSLVQVMLLGELCREWTARIEARCDPPAGVSFEGDLQAYVDRGPDPVRLALTAEVVFEEEEGLSPYVLEAVRASLHAQAKRPNPQGKHWAGLYFGHELMARTQEPMSEAMASSRISAERARATIRFEHAWHAAGPWLATAMTGVPSELVPLAKPALLEEIAADAGHPHLMAAISQTTMRGTIETVEEVVRELRDHAATRTPEYLVALTRLQAEFLVTQGRVEDLETVAETLKECLGYDQQARGRAEAWLAGALNRAHQPARVLARIGAAAQPWETDLDNDLKVSLHHERAGALADSGHFTEALAIRVAVLGLLDETSDRRPWALTNLALTQLELGRPDLALPGLEKAMGMLGPDPSLLGYMAKAHQALNDRPAAEAALAMAEEIAPPDEARRYVLLRAYRLAVGRRYDEAVSLLIENAAPHGTGITKDGWNLVTEAEAWTTLLDRQVALHQTARERAASVPRMLHDLAQMAEAGGQVMLAAAAASRRAGLLDAMRTDEDGDTAQRNAWHEAHAVRERHGLAPEGVTLVKLAFDAYTRADIAAARKRLTRVPAAVAAEIGGVPDISKVVHEPEKLAAPLADLGGLLISRVASAHAGPQSDGPGTLTVEWPDFRLVAELQRDAAGRTAALRRLPVATMLDEGFTDGALAQLASPQQGLVVVEWFHARGQRDKRRASLCSMLTRIDPSGQVSTHFLPQLNIDFSALAGTLRKRLFNWSPRRRGDPLDRPGWRRTEEWIVEVLNTYAQTGDHVVVLEHSAMAGLPWHTAIGPHWSISYASGWTALQSLLQSPPPPRNRVGVLTVPRAGEQPEVAAALRASAFKAARLRASAFAPGEAACDLAAFEKAMNECDVTVLLCHGFVNHSEREVALMLAHLGSPPLADSVAASSSLGNAHRLSWRDCTTLTQTARTVFSAACSSGVNHHAGLGDRLGLFGALRNTGTTAVVAPGWDVVAAAALPVLDDTLARFVQGEPLGRALRQACLTAMEDQPTWLAWSLTLEGDWR